MLERSGRQLVAIALGVGLGLAGCSDGSPGQDARAPGREVSVPDSATGTRDAMNEARRPAELGARDDAFVASGPPRAFPGCQGAGCASTGGRGGKVIEVVNLDDKGAGSLRACVTAPGPRTCVFRVGGTINLASELLITEPGITIAGQTAPGGGILIRGSAMASGDSPMMIKTHDVVVRYLRLRLGKNSLGLGRGVALSIRGDTSMDVRNIVIDHVSLSWGTDENFELWSQGAHVKNVTLSWSISSEGLLEDSRGGIVGSHVSTARLNMTAIDFHHNYFAHNKARSPYLGVAEQQLLNCIVYDWGTEAGIMIRGGLKVDIVGNVTKPGPNSDQGSNPDDLQWFPYESTSCQQGVYCIQGNPSIYLEKNAGHVNGQVSDPNADNWPMLEGWSSTQNEFAVDKSYRRTTPLPAPPAGIALDSATALPGLVLPTVGASRVLDCNGVWVSARDAVDTRVVNDFAQATGKIISDEATAGGFPTITGGTPCTDTDHDGMPDDWEKLHQLSVTAADHNQDRNGDGYTNLEAYLGGIAP